MPLSENPEVQIRLTDPNYADDQGEAVVGTDPVSISSELFDQDGDMPNEAGLSNLFVAWGQFLDHDITLTPEGHTEFLTADGLVAPLGRSEFELDEDGVRIPTNAITWQIDGSQIYGTTEDRTDDLRSFEGGKLRMGEDETSDWGLMPEADPDSFMAGDIHSDDPVFLAGDIRANENPALAAVHTMMAREHNYWAERLAEEHPEWDDEQLFEAARSIVEVELQQITYNEWLPHLVGDAVGEDEGYDPDANGQVSVEFSTAAFRFGHTMVSSDIPLLEADGSDTAEDGDLAIMDAFFNDDVIKEYGIDDILRGQMSSTSQALDTKVVDDLNFFLETPGGMSGFSLVALNLLRGADHGLQSYIDTRAALLGDIDPDAIDPLDFSIITSDADAQAALAAVYDTVHDVDLWVGGLAEDNIDDTQLGPLFTFIVAEQFGRTRAADETFGDLDPALGADIIAEVRASTLADIMERTTEIDTVQADPFVAEALGLTVGDPIEGTSGDDDIGIESELIAAEVVTQSGDDMVTITGGSKLQGGLSTGTGEDTLSMTSGSIDGTTNTGSGNDTVTLRGDAQVDTLLTGSGADVVDIDQGAVVTDVVATGSGTDTITISDRAEVAEVNAGSDDDHIILSDGVEVAEVDGGSGFDTLTITNALSRIEWKDGDPSTGEGVVIYLNEDGSETGQRTTFTNIENVTCFTPGTKIIAARGAVAIEDLQVGDKVYTLDAGLQPIRWIGKTTVLANGKNAPVRFAAGAINNSRAMEVSPQHRMMLADWRAEVTCGDGEVLVPAIHMVNGTTITQRTGGTVEYLHLLFDEHQIVFADGIASESYHPGAVGLGAMTDAVRQELFDLFPELEADAQSYGPAARYSVKPHELRVIRALGSDAA